MKSNYTLSYREMLQILGGRNIIENICLSFRSVHAELEGQPCHKIKQSLSDIKQVWESCYNITDIDTRIQTTMFVSYTWIGILLEYISRNTNEPIH